MHKSPVTVLIAGIGGYGYYYLQELWDRYDPGDVRLAGVVDPEADRSGHIQRIRAEAVPVFRDLDSFYRRGHRADLAIIVSPIQFHAAQSITALRAGSRVLCDKPLAASVAGADEMIAAEQETGSMIMVGYQWSWSDAVQKLKKDLISGRYGRPLRAKTICLWPRGFDYYSRNSWAGRIRDDAGRLVNDSPANNAAAHFLHNLLFLLGDEMDASAEPQKLEADLRRAYAIENFDTVACRIVTRQCPEICFYASHVTEEQGDPVFEIICEGGRVVFGGDRREIVVHTSEGEELIYGTPEPDQFKKMHDAIASLGTRITPLCGTRAAKAQTVCIELMQKRPVEPFSSRMIRKDSLETRLYVEGLGKTLRDCYHTYRLPFESRSSRRNR